MIFGHFVVDVAYHVCVEGKKENCIWPHLSTFQQNQHLQHLAGVELPHANFKWLWSKNIINAARKELGVSTAKKTGYTFSHCVWGFHAVQPSINWAVQTADTLVWDYLRLLYLQLLFQKEPVEGVFQTGQYSIVDFWHGLDCMCLRIHVVVCSGVEFSQPQLCIRVFQTAVSCWHSWNPSVNEYQQTGDSLEFPPNFRGRCEKSQNKKRILAPSLTPDSSQMPAITR